MEQYIKSFSNLHTARIKGHKAPHKAVLLLAVIDFIENGIISSPQIKLDENLVDHFKVVWFHYLGNSAIFTPDIAKPFYHMQHETFWWLVEHKESQNRRHDEDGPDSSHKPKCIKVLTSNSYSLKSLRTAFEYAEIEKDLFVLLQNPDVRATLRTVLIKSYLVDQPTQTLPNNACEKNIESEVLLKKSIGFEEFKKRCLHFFHLNQNSCGMSNPKVLEKLRR